MPARYRKLTVALSAASILVLAACSSGDTTQNPGSGGASNGGANKKGVKVAFVAPLTSGNSTFANQMKNAAQLAAKQYNESSSAKCTVTISAYDDKGTAEDATKVVLRAISADGAQAVIGAYAGVEALAIKELAERQRVVFISSSSISPGITQDTTYPFRTSVTLLAYPATYAALIKKLGLKAPAIIADDGPTGTPLVKPVSAALSAVGISQAGPAITFPANSTDLTATVQQAKAQNPDSVIVLGSVGADQGLLLKTAYEQGLKIPFAGNSAISSPNAQTVGGDAYKSMDIYSFFNQDPSKPEYRNFLSKYSSAYGQDKRLTEAAPQTYDAVMILGAALDQTGCDAGGSELARAIHALPPQSAAAGPVNAKLSFDGSQDGFKDAQLVPFKLVNGTPTAVS